MTTAVGGIAINIGANAAEMITEMDRAAQAVLGESRRMKRGLDSAQQGFRQVEVSSRRMSGAVRSNVGNVAFQVQDFIVQVSSGTSAMRAFAQQAPQMFVGFGPAGAIVGTIAAAVGALGGAIFSAGDDAEGAGQKIAGMVDALKGLEGQAARTADQMVRAFAEANASIRDLTGSSLEIQAVNLGRARDAARTQLGEAISGVIDEGQLRERAAIGGDALAANVIEVVEAYKREELTLKELNTELLRAEQTNNATGEALAGQTQKIIDAATAYEQLKQQLDEVGQAQERIRLGIGELSNQPFGPEPPPTGRGSRATAAGQREPRRNAFQFGPPAPPAIAVPSRITAEQARALEATDQLNKSLAEQQRLAQGIASSFANFATTAVFEGLDTAAQQFVRTLVQMTLQLAIQAAIMSALGFATGGSGFAAAGAGAGAGGGGPLGAVLGGFGQLFGRASGGPVFPGTSFLVGERGPEVFTPSAVGQITPTNAIGSVNIDARGAQVPVGSDINRAIAGFERRLPSIMAEAQRRGG